jgi:hypothetical protein
MRPLRTTVWPLTALMVVSAEIVLMIGALIAVPFGAIEIGTPSATAPSSLFAA